MAKLEDPAALDKHMATKSYVAGFTLSAADVELYRKIAPPPPKFDGIPGPAAPPQYGAY